MKKIYLILLILLLTAVISILYLTNQQKSVDVKSFEECEQAGYPVGESYPRVCFGPDGKTFTEAIPKPTSTTVPNGDENIACTMDAKLCPDGSYVGRIPPTCEFAPCPGEMN